MVEALRKPTILGNKDTEINLSKLNILDRLRRNHPEFVEITLFGEDARKGHGVIVGARETEKPRELKIFGIIYSDGSSSLKGEEKQDSFEHNPYGQLNE